MCWWKKTNKEHDRKEQHDRKEKKNTSEILMENFSVEDFSSEFADEIWINPNLYEMQKDRELIDGLEE